MLGARLSACWRTTSREQVSPRPRGAGLPRPAPPGGGDRRPPLGAAARDARLHAPARRRGGVAVRRAPPAGGEAARGDPRPDRARSRALPHRDRPAALVGIHQLVAAPAGDRGGPRRHDAQQQLRGHEPDRGTRGAQGDRVARRAARPAAGDRGAARLGRLHGEPRGARGGARGQAARDTGARPARPHQGAHGVRVERGALLHPPRGRAPGPGHGRPPARARGRGIPHGRGGAGAHDRRRPRRGAPADRAGGERRDREHGCRGPDCRNRRRGGGQRLLAPRRRGVRRRRRSAAGARAPLPRDRARRLGGHGPPQMAVRAVRGRRHIGPRPRDPPGDVRAAARLPRRRGGCLPRRSRLDLRPRTTTVTGVPGAEGLGRRAGGGPRRLPRAVAQRHRGGA